MGLKRRGSSKNPPIFSHEFVIQNHADIVACVAMIFVVGLMFQISSSVASVFIALHHNVSVPASEAPPGISTTSSGDVILYTNGLLDIPAIFFYFLIAIVMHQIIQEYILDKVNRKLHLSKSKHAKFNESGQLIAFYIVSLFWAGDILYRENLMSIRSLWEGYPHLNMTFMFKFFFIFQISYWTHIFPELYFQRVKREDMGPKIQGALLHLLFIGGAYSFNYTRVSLSLLILHYFTDLLFHVSRLLSYLDKSTFSHSLYSLHDISFVFSRLGSISLAVLTFWYGLALHPMESQIYNVYTGNYNTLFFRLNALLSICLLQALLMWNFITFQLQSKREKAAAAKNPFASHSSSVSSKGKAKNLQQEKAAKRKEKAKNVENDELPEVDQNTLRQRK